MELHYVSWTVLEVGGGPETMERCMKRPAARSGKAETHRKSFQIGLAAVGIGILLGIWVAGPALDRHRKRLHPSELREDPSRTTT